jgi:hypothetical protein
MVRMCSWCKRIERNQLGEDKVNLHPLLGRARLAAPEPHDGKVSPVRPQWASIRA